jgi:hypothetical protein
MMEYASLGCAFILDKEGNICCPGQGLAQANDHCNARNYTTAVARAIYMLLMEDNAMKSDANYTNCMSQDLSIFGWLRIVLLCRKHLIYF